MRARLVLPIAAALLCAAPAGARAATWHGTAEGIRVGERHASSGTPPDDVTFESDDNYQVSLRFSFTVARDGTISGSGKGHYDDAHWHLDGHNGGNGDFSCDPPVSGDDFSVDVSGSAQHGHARIALSIDGEERNDDYDCGASFSGFATTSTYMSDSLALVGGGNLRFSLAHPQLPARTKTVDSGSAPNTRHVVDVWSFSLTPPATGGGGGGGGAGGSCRLKLSRLRTRPSKHHVGLPTTVGFRTTAPSHATLLVKPPGGGAQTVAAANLGAGPNSLVWGGWLGSLPAPAGRYRLTVKARGCGVTRRRSTTISVT